jgi:hypothetical protein
VLGEVPYYHVVSAVDVNVLPTVFGAHSIRVDTARRGELNVRTADQNPPTLSHTAT